ncbi:MULTISPECIES: alpha/beta hydrolase [unclassified Ensifer]|uniref:alpha/beta hydrolase n=1 Tax=unclassified Ensifer TaxID=2633371 RepID=UPI000712AA8B|nr:MULTISPECIES: alpha/beta hydrolase [unclassified Ensifer]KQX56540.1 esterase [Ensifer sp. Root1298]KQX92196.1 esterase [Ensifer sp. Root1312]KRC27736.1 esterase [Ensifer sp. Root74]KRD59547.1 esterase [Ensifer sp. Root954]
MLEHRISDWDDAYANGSNIARGDRWPEAWVKPAEAFRNALLSAGRAKLDLAYGDRPRNRMDLFLPDGSPKGLVVFVHGGYWLQLDKSFWSHLAAGAVERGYAVAMPSYTLCPKIRIAGIVEEVAAAISEASKRVEGPLMLTGHSAGGHLVSRMITTSAPLSPDVQGRIRNVVSISGVHDLRPIMSTAMNEKLAIDEAEALSQSPALLRPMPDARITCWVGGGERAEFLRQNALLANIWTGLGATTAAVAEPDRHHFNVVDGLADVKHPLVRTLLLGV